ncbi:MAG: exodeoxyribonuclease VII large subunit [bacterium]|nr:exodeoxyribonuclease VII large subunit [bacterium]
MDVTYEVGELATEIARVLGRAFPDQIWVKGQIRNLSRAQSGHVYFSLIDAAEVGDSAAAQLPVTLFASDKDAVNQALIRAGAGRMDDGVEVRIRGHVQHFPARGVVQLRMTWIDTDFTLGRLAAARAALLKRLEAAGHLERNRAIPFPPLPLQVGLVTSLGSAAHADFMETLRASGWAFRVSEVDARVQGPEAPDSIARSIATLQGRVEVIVVIRGGGSALDLAAFDSETVAVAIATSGVPVITGIGHEIDNPVAGDVAHVAAKTPTAAAQLLVDRVSDAARRLDAAAATVGHHARRGLRVAGRELDRRAAATAGVSRLVVRAASAQLGRSAIRIARASQLAVRRRSESLDLASTRLVPAANRFVATATDRLDGLEVRVNSLDPRRLLERGWSVTRNGAGAVVRSPSAAPVGSELRTTVAEGEIVSRVEEN